MLNKKEITYNAHATTLSQIALHILKGNDKILSLPGVRETIALYLLIPYITPDQLDTPGKNYAIPKLELSEIFTGEITLENLRNAICHSFVSFENSTNDYLGRLILDDRSMMSFSKHKHQDSRTRAVGVDIREAHHRLSELHEQVLRINNFELIDDVTNIEGVTENTK